MPISGRFLSLPITHYELKKRTNYTMFIFIGVTDASPQIMHYELNKYVLQDEQHCQDVHRWGELLEFTAAHIYYHV